MSILPIEYGITQVRDPFADSIRSLRQPTLKPYQEAFIRELLAEEHKAVTMMVPLNGGYNYQRGVDSYIAKLSVDRLNEMAA